MGYEISGSLQTLACYVEEFNNKMASMSAARLGGMIGANYKETLVQAVDAATKSFNAVLIPKIQELEQNLAAI